MPQVLQAPQIDVLPILPEILLVGTGILVLIVDSLRPSRDPGPIAFVALAGILGAAAVAASLWSWDGGRTVLAGTVSADRFTVFFRLVLLSVSALAVLLSQHYLGRTQEQRGEYYALLLFATAGMTLLSASADLLLVFLSIEVLSLSLYVLTSFSLRRPASQEAGMKYFLLGAFSSAFLLYGVAMAYGATGTTKLSGIADALTGRTGDLELALLAAALLAVGFAFKVAAVPFHMWTPDVYQGAPTPVTAFMSAGTKIAGFAALLRVAMTALGPLAWDITPALWTLAALSMVVGSVLAIGQRDFKRMLAYSSIGHAGFVLVGVVAANQQGINGSMFYLAVYAAMIMGGFGVGMLVSGPTGEESSLSSFAGLGRRSPLLAGLLALFLLSLAGVPPTAGFVAKVLVFQAAIDAGHWPLVVIGVLATVVAAFFYLRVIVLSYMQDAETEAAIRTPPGPGVAVAVTAAFTLIFGVLPWLLTNAIESAGILRF